MNSHSDVPNIYIIGPQSTGKTTLVNKLQGDLGHWLADTSIDGPQIIAEVARTVLAKHKYSAEDIQTLTSRCFELQQLILEVQASSEKEALRTSSWVISDRSGFDPLVYAKRYAAPDTVTQLKEIPAWKEVKARMESSLIVRQRVDAAFSRRLRNVDEVGLQYFVVPRTVLDISERPELIMSGVQVAVHPVHITPQQPDSATIKDVLPRATKGYNIPRFDPQIHLNFKPPAARYSFTELGLDKPRNAPDVCYTEPFQLFSEEGVRVMRREIFRKEFLDKYMRSWSRAPCYIGGHSANSEEASFIKQAWYHPATQAAIDEAFGTGLKPLERHCDIGYANVQLGEGGTAGVYKYNEIPAKPQPPSKAATGISKSQWDDVPIDGWHKDQVPVVCVVMLSDISNMQGGETAIRTGQGNLIKARGANLGGAVLMQGGNLEHAALRASNCSERVSMVTSYCFANPDLDDSRTTLKSADFENEDMNALKYAHLDYKLKRLRDRVNLACERVARQRAGNAELNRDEIDEWVKEQVGFLKQTSWELFERDESLMGLEMPDGILRDYLED
ncbi:hypothetical protein ACKLNR_015377 [Fusarium oxysporum f. sp. zingiberi]